ncbi:MAG: fused DSP-PTPase phosphatase/NAD kinase-like protein [Bryobacteraceae bacterium]
MNTNIRVYPCAFVALFATAAFAGTIHVRNFSQVDAHVYRGAAPSEAGLKDLRALHITIDLDLRERGKPEARERAEAKQLGMKYINIGMPPLSAPTPGEVKRALAVLLAADAGSGRVFVHCQHGRDRTGTVIACYRIEHDGWSNRRAFREAKQHGISWFERGMRSYIKHFRPITIQTAVAASGTSR